MVLYALYCVPYVCRSFVAYVCVDVVTCACCMRVLLLLYYVCLRVVLCMRVMFFVFCVTRTHYGYVLFVSVCVVVLCSLFGMYCMCCVV